MNLTKLKNHRNVVEQRHRKLDTDIEILFSHPGVGDAEITELKKQKLQLKQELETINQQIARMESHHG
jgi:hypothetical protein